MIKLIVSDMDGTFLNPKGAYDKERFQKLLDKMPLSLNKAYDDLKRVIDTEYQNKLDELNKESQIINAMGMLSQDNLGMFDENKHMTFGIDDSSRIKK